MKFLLYLEAVFWYDTLMKIGGKDCELPKW